MGEFESFTLGPDRTGNPPTAPEKRARIRNLHRIDEDRIVRDLVKSCDLSKTARDEIVTRAASWVEAVRARGSLGLMESVLAAYGLSTDEGVALMTLAEALLRVPDAETADALVADKIGPGDWAEHIGRSASMLVNGSTLGLALTGRVVDPRTADGLLRQATQRLGAPIIRTATRAAMRQMGHQFVLGQTIDEALSRARKAETRGYTYSYDMLGEAAMTAKDAAAFYRSYAAAIAAISRVNRGNDIRTAPGISIKLSALHPRYEWAQRDRVLRELVPRVTELAKAAATAGIGLNIDAEEQNRLELSLDVFKAVLSEKALAGWDGFGVVVQAYGKRALPVIEWLDEIAARLDRRIMVRVVKGAYWDTEIKLAQVDGLPDFPVFTAKSASDVSYLACAARLLRASDRIYPQFATHNAHTIAAVLRLAEDQGVAITAFEFQRLHGMGEAIHDHVVQTEGVRSRIYAPVGRHKELLAYLVRRLLENGANSSFVNRLADPSLPPEEVVADPFPTCHDRVAVAKPSALFAPRVNSRGWDLQDPGELERLEQARAPWHAHTWKAAPVLADGSVNGEANAVRAPADPNDQVGSVIEADTETTRHAIDLARPWQASPDGRARILRAAADGYEAAAPEAFALLAREAGKTLPDAVAELREAVDFLRYYADEIERIDPDGQRSPRGIIAAISPWNFPLAIFTGQIAAALAAGNAVIAKPAEPTPLIATLGVRLMHEAGVPRTALQIVPGQGRIVGTALTADPRVKGVAFTGSTATAQAIHRNMAAHLDPHAMLLAETGGLNAMIVDSTALPEQVVRDVVASAFQSAGQRCSACRILYIQDDIADDVLEMLQGAMEELCIGDPYQRATDIGPIITEAARQTFVDYVAVAEAEGRVLHRANASDQGHFFGPTLLRVSGIDAMDEEMFGPILHVATFAAGALEATLDAINHKGYGLTMGVHSRIQRVAELVEAQAYVGNLYVNRNQIGAIVGSQPFGGERLSGTGPKAGGPDYVQRFCAPARVVVKSVAGPRADVSNVQAALDGYETAVDPVDTIRLPGPTGESNLLRRYPRPPVICLGPGAERALAQASEVRKAGGHALAVAPGLKSKAGLDGVLQAEDLARLHGFGAVMTDADDARSLRRALAARDGAILPLLTSGEAHMAVYERHTCTDTTAAGGNANLLTASGKT